VAQEALNNSVKYSNSSLIEVKLGVYDHLIRMTIKDFGTGFNPSTAARGLGLATMRERLRSVEGDLAVVSRPGEGTEVIAKARLEPSSKRVAAA
jgi:signal transduction histidine kinase